MAAESAELAFVATMRDEASAVARSARKTLDSVGGATKPITTEVKADASSVTRAAAEAEAASADIKGSMSGALDGVKGSLSSAASGIGSGITSALDSATGDLALGSKISDSLSSGKGKILAVAAGIGAAVGATVLASTNEAMSREVSTDRLSASLGATPAEAKRYGDLAGKLYAGAWGDSMDDVTTAIGAVKSSIRGLGTGGELESASIKAMDFANIFEIDVTRAAQVAGNMISNGMAKDSTQAFDLLTAASQRVPAQLREDVLDAADEYGQFFAGLGIDGEQAFTMLAKGADKGMYGIDKIGDAVKEFSILVSTDMARTKPVIKSLGMDYNKTANDLIAGGDRAAGATNRIVSGLLKIKDPAKQARAAVELFGTPLEDLNVKDVPAFLRSMQQTSGGLGKIEGASKRAGNAVNDNATTNIKSFVRQIQGGFVNVIGGAVLPKVNALASALSSGLGPAWDAVSSALAPVKPLLGPIGAGLAVAAGVIGTVVAVTKAWAIAQGILNAVLAINPVVLIVAAILGLVAALILAWRKSETFRNVVMAVWNGIKAGVSAAVNAVKGAVSAAWNAIKGATSATWNAIKAVISGVWKGIVAAVKGYIAVWKAIVTGGFKAAQSVVKGTMSAIKSVIATAWKGVQVVVKGAVAVIKAVMGSGFSAASTVVSKYMTVIRTVIGTVLGVAKALVSGALAAIKAIFTGNFSALPGIASNTFGKVKSLISDALGRIKSAVVDGIRAVVDYFTGLGGKILGAVGNLGSLLFNAGKDIIGGLLDGITSMIGSVTSKLGELTSKIPDWKGPAKRDKTLLRKNGRLIIRGLLDGFKDSVREVRDWLGKLTKEIGDYFGDRFKSDKRARRATRAAMRDLRDEYRKITANARLRDRVVKRLERAEDRLAGRIKARRDYAKGIREELLDSASVTSIETVNDAPLTAGFIAKGLRERLVAIRRYRADLATLRRRGVDADIIRDIEAQGVEGGAEAADALANATRGQLRQINATQRQIERVAKGTGNTAAGHWYDAGIQAARGVVKGIRRELRNVTRAGRRLARALRRAVRQELRIKSPSRALREDGRQTVAGLTGGILEHARDAERAAADVAARVRDAAVPSLTQLAELSRDTFDVSSPTVVTRTHETHIIRHEVAFKGPGADKLSAAEVADIIARDPKAARRIENALRPARAKAGRNTISASR